MRSRITKNREKFTPVSLEITFENIEELAYCCALFNKDSTVFQRDCKDAFEGYPEGLVPVEKAFVWSMLDDLYSVCRSSSDV